jgi:hypothetical protein
MSVYTRSSGECKRMLSELLPIVGWFDAHYGAVVVSITIVLAITSILLWIATLSLGRFAGRHADGLSRLIAATEASTNATAISSEAARHFFETMQVNGERQLRAYVSVSEAHITTATGTTPPIISLELRNFGQTPAYDLIWLAGCTVSPASDAAAFVLDRTAVPPKSTLFPAATASKATIPPGWKPEYGEMIRAGKAAIYAFGEISYTDAFGKKRLVTYRFKRGGSLGVQPERLLPTEEGNEEK